MVPKGDVSTIVCEPETIYMAIGLVMHGTRFVSIKSIKCRALNSSLCKCSMTGCLTLLGCLTAQESWSVHESISPWIRAVLADSKLILNFCSLPSNVLVSITPTATIYLSCDNYYLSVLEVVLVVVVH